jgi:hypothetical protein
MLLVLQFPFADSRAFLTANPNRLNYPEWPKPDLEKDRFIRSFGKVVKRRRGGGGLIEWAGESLFCHAKGALAFTKLPPLTKRPTEIHSTCIFRRFLSDGDACSRFEIGLSTLNKITSKLSSNTCEEVIDNFLKIPTRVQKDGNEHIVNLVEANRYIGANYLRESTSQSHS